MILWFSVQGILLKKYLCLVNLDFAGRWTEGQIGDSVDWIPPSSLKTHFIVFFLLFVDYYNCVHFGHIQQMDATVLLLTY